jgi:hypothetical protein
LIDASTTVDCTKVIGTGVSDMLIARTLLVSALALAAAPAAAQPFVIDWHTIDGGGGVSTGGVFIVEGTIGQFDAGVSLTGGSFVLDGGYWGPVDTDGPCNSADFALPYGVMDFFDVQAFLGFFSAMDERADLIGDGVFDFFDVQAFLNAFSSGCP